MGALLWAQVMLGNYSFLLLDGCVDPEGGKAVLEKQNYTSSFHRLAAQNHGEQEVSRSLSSYAHMDASSVLTVY